jgi:ABC-type nickel/cobalt efflux system permease component RcnA
MAVQPIGWREMTAVGDGVHLTSSTVPSRSRSDVLRDYPADLLDDPLDQREARLRVEAGSGVVTGPMAATAPDVGSPAGLAALASGLDDLVSARQLSVGLGFLAFGIAVVLGSLHAFAPGHGKTLMAAYLVGRNGTLRDAALIGASVTVTHTAGVLVLGVMISATLVVAPEQIYSWLSLASGLLLLVIGLALLRAGWHRWLGGDSADDHGYAHGHRHSHGPHGHPHGPSRRHSHGPHRHSHGHPHGAHDDEQLVGHGHGPDGDPAAGHRGGSHGSTRAGTSGRNDPHTSTVVMERAAHHDTRSSSPEQRSARRGAGRRGLLAVGFAGGLVPSPSALVVLLGGIALGRAWFGVLLVLAYGLGMALALVGTGLLLVRARDVTERWFAEGRREGGAAQGLRFAVRVLPLVTAGLVVVVGVGVTGQALARL